MSVKCRICGADVSTDANDCPLCGYPQKQEQADVPECPACNSTEVGRISVGNIEKPKFLWVSLKNLTYTYECKKCGHKW
jgi:ribosomal protein L37E